MPFGKEGGVFSGKKQQRCVPVACRVVPMDQWFTTHIDQTWYVQDLKIWLLSKALPSGVLPLPPSYRPSSPVLFATDSSITEKERVRKTHDNDEDVDGFSISDANDTLDTSFVRYIPNNNVNSDSSNLSGLQAVAPYSYKRGEFSVSDRAVDPTLLSKMVALSKRWQVYSFSTGMKFSDEVPLVEYSLSPYYLFELHRTGDYIHLPKVLPDNFWSMNLRQNIDEDLPSLKGVSLWSYQQPYFDTWTWVFTALKIDTSSGKDDVIESRQGNMKEALVSGGWKKAWIVVRDGLLYLFHDKGDSAPVGKFDLAECIGLSGEDKIKPIINSHFHGIDHNVLGFVPHWRQGVPTVSQGPRNRNAKFAICIRFRRPHVIKQNSLLYTLLYEKSSWLLLDFPDKTTYEHILRVLHRLMYFNPALISDNLPPHLYPRRTLQTEFLPGTIPPPHSIRFASRSSPRASPVSTIVDDGESHSSKTTIGSMGQLGLGNDAGVKFPEWREQVLRRAMVSNHGFSFEGIMWSKLPRVTLRNQDDLHEHHDDTYDSPVSDISNESSESEWRGWAYDLDREKPLNFCSADRRISMDSGQRNAEELSYLPRNRTQSVFSLTVNPSKFVPDDTIPDISSPIGGRPRSSTVSLKKPPPASPKMESFPLPGAESSTTSTRRFIRALGSKSTGKS